MSSKKNVVVFYYDRFAEFEIALAMLYLGNHSIRTVALEKREISSMEGQRFLPDDRLDEIDPTGIALLVIPGGHSEPLLGNRQLAVFIRAAVSAGAVIAGICGGADLLVSLGFLEGKRCTGNALDLSNPETLQAAYRMTVFVQEPVVTDGAFITAQSEAFEEFASVLAFRLQTPRNTLPVFSADWLHPVQGWTEVSDSVKVSTGKFEACNLTLVISGKEALLVDTGYRTAEAERVLTFLKENGLKLKQVVITHRHEDHDANLRLFPVLNPIYDPSNVGNETILKVGNKTVRLFPTPGHHQKGDISAFVEEDNILIVGDILFSCLPPMLCYGGKPDILTMTIQKIADRHCRWIVPGHGRVMSGDAMTAMALSYIRILEEKLKAIVDHHGTEDDLCGIKLSECILHPEWMIEEPAIDLHRQNKAELFGKMTKPE